MDIDVKELSAEIRQIDQEYRQTSDRLSEVLGRGRGRGRGRFRTRGRGRSFGRSYSTNERGRWNEMESDVPEPRVASSISGAYQDEVKRPANHGLEEDPKIKIRNRRMFSSLLSTLEKFREENDTVEKSEKWKKREEISRRALQRTAEESQRLREKQKKEWEERREQETKKLEELDKMRKIKGLQLIYAKRRQQKEWLLNYLGTQTLPSIYWLPAKHNAETQAMMDANVSGHEKWAEEQQESFEKEKLRIESGLPLEEELMKEEPKVKSTIHIPEEIHESDEDEGMEFQPVSELNNEILGDVKDEEGSLDDAPVAKKPKIEEVSEREEKSSADAE